MIWRWAVLIALSAVIAGLLELVGLPAGLLLGPMIAAVVLAVRGWSLTVPTSAFRGAQAAVGTLIAGSITTGIVATVADHWPVFLMVNFVTLAASSVLGYLLSRWQVLPGTVAVWGSTPGAASAMVLMAQAYGADSRLVAVMTYTRVVSVAVVASVLAAVMVGGGSGHHPVTWFAAVDPLVVLRTIGVAGVGAGIGIALRLPAGALLGSLIAGAALNVTGVAQPVLPQWLLAISYAVVGWRIGLSFTRDTLRVAGRAMPRILLSVALLIAFCGGIAAALARWWGVDPVTAYLATSPGGMDSVAIIAASSPVDVPFVMALQVMRFLGVLVIGPPLAKFVATRQGGVPPPGIPT
ncbi:AbrB family transcriptional regulator [Sphingomonas faeni]|uniref:AbrB family transcriptional regulator n=1 Tax=Sphingomonas faeni TaxID=185950 RepID=UPI0020C804C3|nr:AbrB family transcriptional regulator [Sphingomonas faeni]MCP8889390.1 AbrB family transcriptional regulator [Sphingomonas faeni]